MYHPADPISKLPPKQRRDLLLRWGYMFSMINYVLMVLVDSFYFYPLDKLNTISLIYYISILFPHCFWFTLVYYVISILPLGFFFNKDDWNFRAVVCVFFTIMLSYNLFDQELYRILQLHLNWTLLLDLLHNNSVSNFKQLSIFITAIPWVLLIEFMIGSAIWRKITDFTVSESFARFTVFFGSLMLILFGLRFIIYYCGKYLQVEYILNKSGVLPLMF